MKIKKKYMISWWRRVFLWFLPLKGYREIDGTESITDIGFKYWRGVIYVVKEKVVWHI